jgi:hypothetical protein
MYKLMGLLIKVAASIAYRVDGNLARLNDALQEHALILNAKNYYGPFVSKGDITKPLDDERYLPGLILSEATMFGYLDKLDYADELTAIPDVSDDEMEYFYRNDMFGPGDAEIFYGMIRHLKPRRLIEIGAGKSTLMAQKAIAANRQDDASYRCRHICVEPYENPWLERLDVEIVRQKVEDLPISTFQQLEANDILFVDSSHVVKPQGDVLFEIFDIYGSIAPGVYVHVHDIYTPRDYPHDVIIERRALWHEQYILEAFLSFNPRFEVVCALNWLWKNHPGRLGRACPVLSRRANFNPGSFWFKRV